MQFIFKILGGFLFLFFLIGAFLYTFGTSDLRTEIAKTNPQPKKAKALLEKMAQAHAIQNWDSLSTYRIEMEDHFFGMMGAAGNPYKEDSIHIMLNYIPKTYTGSLDFLSGKDMGKTWGIQSWYTYDVSAKNGLRFRDKSDIYFWLPTYQYFIEFPMRIQKATALAYAGEKEINGVLCDGVIASWKTIAPQRDTDQYLIWLDKKTNRIQKLEYTVREQYNFLTGAAYFKNYKNFEGMLLPTFLPVESNLVRDDWLHKMFINDFEPDYLATDDLRPDKSLDIIGDDKPLSDSQ